MSFVDDIAKFTNKTLGNVDMVTRKVIIDIGAKLVYRSPVGDAQYWSSPAPKGYVGGRFRANWQYGFGREATGEVFMPDPSGGMAMSRLMSDISSQHGVHYITNNLPYAYAIEHGHSKRQAPQGVVMLTVLDFQNVVGIAAQGVKR